MVTTRIFTSKNRVKILFFFFFNKESSYLRDISKKTGISVSAVKSEVDNLVECGILTIENNDIKLNKKCPFLKDLENILIKTDAVYNPISNSINKLDVKFALIFGSFANNKFNADSDVDLLVVGNVTQSEVFEKLKSAEKLIGREINAVVWKVDDLKKNRSMALLKDILIKNKIFIIGDENEFRQIVE